MIADSAITSCQKQHFCQVGKASQMSKRIGNEVFLYKGSTLFRCDEQQVHLYGKCARKWVLVTLYHLAGHRSVIVFLSMGSI